MSWKTLQTSILWLVERLSNIMDANFSPSDFFDSWLCFAQTTPSCGTVFRVGCDVKQHILISRGYSVHKIQENVEAEIMQMILEEARNSYAEGIIVVSIFDFVLYWYSVCIIL